MKRQKKSVKRIGKGAERQEQNKRKMAIVKRTSRNFSQLGRESRENSGPFAQHPFNEQQSEKKKFIVFQP